MTSLRIALTALASACALSLGCSDEPRGSGGAGGGGGGGILCVDPITRISLEVENATSRVLVLDVGWDEGIRVEPGEEGFIGGTVQFGSRFTCDGALEEYLPDAEELVARTSGGVEVFREPMGDGWTATSISVDPECGGVSCSYARTITEADLAIPDGGLADAGP